MGADQSRRATLLSTAVVATVVVAVVGVVVASERALTETAPVGIATQAVALGDMAIGSPAAALTLVVVAGRRCRACLDFARRILPAIVEHDVQRGDLQVRVRVRPGAGAPTYRLGRTGRPKRPVSSSALVPTALRAPLHGLGR